MFRKKCTRNWPLLPQDLQNKICEGGSLSGDPPDFICFGRMDISRVNCNIYEFKNNIDIVKKICYYTNIVIIMI